MLLALIVVFPFAHADAGQLLYGVVPVVAGCTAGSAGTAGSQATACKHSTFRKRLRLQTGFAARSRTRNPRS